MTPVPKPQRSIFLCLMASSRVIRTSSVVIVLHLPVLQFRSAPPAEGIGDPTLLSAAGTVFRFVLPWRAVRTMQNIRVVHGIAHPSAAFVAEVEMLPAFLLPGGLQLFCRIITAVWFRCHHRHPGCIAEETVASSAVLFDDLIGGGPAFLYPIYSAPFPLQGRLPHDICYIIVQSPRFVLPKNLNLGGFGEEIREFLPFFQT